MYLGTKIYFLPMDVAESKGLMEVGSSNVTLIGGRRIDKRVYEKFSIDGCFLHRICGDGMVYVTDNRDYDEIVIELIDWDRCDGKTRELMMEYSLKEDLSAFMNTGMMPTMKDVSAGVLFAGGGAIQTLPIGKMNDIINERVKDESRFFHYNDLLNNIMHDLPRIIGENKPQTIKPVKIVNKMRTLTGDSPLNEDSTKRLIASLKGTFGMEFKVVTGEELRTYYHQDRTWKKEKDTLGKSCMRYDECQSWLDIYVRTGARMLILTDVDSGLIAGRAIVWDITVKGEDITFMDRVYVNNQTDVPTFIRYATENGWAYKKEQTYRNSIVVMPDGETLDFEGVAEIHVEVPHKYTRYPYMDTFKYISRCGSILTPSKKGVSIEKALTCHRGNNTDWSGDYVDNRTMASLERALASPSQTSSEDTDSERTFCCSECNEIYPVSEEPRVYNSDPLCQDCVDDISDISYIDSENMYAHREDATYCDHCDELEIHGSYIDADDVWICNVCADEEVVYFDEDGDDTDEPRYRGRVE